MQLLELAVPRLLWPAGRPHAAAELLISAAPSLPGLRCRQAAALQLRNSHAASLHTAPHAAPHPSVSCAHIPAQPATSAGDEGESAALAAITKESERAMEQLDDAITSSWELLEVGRCAAQCWAAWACWAVMTPRRAAWRCTRPAQAPCRTLQRAAPCAPWLLTTLMHVPAWHRPQGTNDPADPELLAADRVLAAASQRAAAMNKALEAAAAQRLLGDGGKDGKPGRK